MQQRLSSTCFYPDCSAHAEVKGTPANLQHDTCAGFKYLLVIICLCVSAFGLLTPAAANGQAPNRMPWLDPLVRHTISLGQSLDLVIKPFDPDGDVPSLAILNAPSGASFDDAGNGGRRLLWRPTGEQLGNTAIIVIATDARDSTMSVTQRLEISVLNAGQSVALVQNDALSTASDDVNRSGTLEADSQNGVGVNEVLSSDEHGDLQFPTIGDVALPVGNEVSLRVTAMASAGVPGISLLSGPGGATLTDNGDGSRTFRWQSRGREPGSYNVMLQATHPVDSSSVLQQSFRVNVVLNDIASVATPEIINTDVADAASSAVGSTNPGNSNQPPVVQPLADQFMQPGGAVIFRVTPIDPEGTPAILVVDPLPAGASFDDNGDGTRTFFWQTSDVHVGEHRINFTAFDGLNPALSHSESLTITVGSAGVGSSVSGVSSGLENSAAASVVDDAPIVTPSDVLNETASGAGLQSASTTTNLIDILPIAEQLGRPNRNLSFRVVPRHPDRPVPSLVLRNAPRGSALYDNGDGTRLFAWTPNNEQVGIFTFDIIAVDAWDSALVAVQPVRLVIDNDVAAAVAIADPGNSPPMPESMADAVRFLTRATFGATAEEVNSLRGKTYEQWINDQFGTPLTSHLNRLDGYLWDRGLFNISTGDRQLERSQLRSDAFWEVIVNAKDQLRQRVAFALSQILVISDRDPALENRVRGFAHYHDTLLKHSFGNYRQLLSDIALNPMMGDFLSSRRNEKAEPDLNIEPDENFARELMQLFTIGLDQLENDGTRKRDSNGQRLLAYDQQDVMNFARVFTGWNYGDSNQMRDDRRTLESEILPMKAYEDFHDRNPKQLLDGQTVSGGRSARDDLELALDNLFNHTNVPPFVSRQLIQRLVTSNPTPAYIERVSNIFRNNGNGTRGDLAAVVKAILLDPEALNGHSLDSFQFGKLKEPVVKIASIWRAFNARGRYNRFRYADPNKDFAQQPYSASSVFNFYSPDYRPPGTVGELGLYSPEAQLMNESTAVRGNNRLFDYAFEIPLGNDEIYANQHQITLDLGPWLALSPQPAALVEGLNQLLMAGQMSEHMKDVLTRLAGRTRLNDNGSNRVREVIHMIFVSPEFSIQR